MEYEPAMSERGASSKKRGPGQGQVLAETTALSTRWHRLFFFFSWVSEDLGKVADPRPEYVMADAAFCIPGIHTVLVPLHCSESVTNAHFTWARAYNVVSGALN